MMRIGPKEKADLLKAAMWPSVILIAFVLFYKPVNRMLNSLADRSDDIQTIKVGTLELSIRQKDITAPRPAVAAALQQMSAQEVETLFARESNTGACYSDGKNDARYKKDERLVQLGLITMISEKNSQSWCPNSHAVTVTELGKETKSFITGLLSEIVVKKRPS
jgi:hypothetical protein